MSNLCTIDLQDDGAIAVVTLNHPADANAMSPEMGDAFRDIMTELKDRKGLRAAIICGAGGNFAIGGQRDMLVMLGSDSMDAKGRHDFMMKYYDRWLTVLELPVPVIAAFDGECLGVAPVFAFLCDIALADEMTHFEITFASAALFPGMGLAKLIPDAIGRSRAGLTLIGGVPFSGAEAERMGVVARSVPAGTVHHAALALAKRIVANSEDVVRELVTSLRIKRVDLNAQLDSDAAAQARSYASAEYRKRIADYLPNHYDGGSL